MLLYFIWIICFKLFEWSGVEWSACNCAGKAKGSLTCLAGVRNGRGRELGRAQIPPSPLTPATQAKDSSTINKPFTLP